MTIAFDAAGVRRCFRIPGDCATLPEDRSLAPWLFGGCLLAAAALCCVGLPLEVSRISQGEAFLRSRFRVSLERWPHRRRFDIGGWLPAAVSVAREAAAEESRISYVSARGLLQVERDPLLLRKPIPIGRRALNGAGPLDCGVRALFDLGVEALGRRECDRGLAADRCRSHGFRRGAKSRGAKPAASSASRR
jgi:hypothetical protein